jgi:hypothetical protein
VGGATWGGRRVRAAWRACGRRDDSNERNEREAAGARPGDDLGPLFLSAGLRPTKIVVGQ